MSLYTFLQKQKSQRKLRLFGVACCQSITHLLNKDFIDILNTAELHADNKITMNELREICRKAYMLKPKAISSSYDNEETFAKETAFDAVTALTAYNAKFAINNILTVCLPPAGVQIDYNVIVKDIFTKTTTKIPINRNIQHIAHLIYETKEWAHMPILADALEDICTTGTDKIINHLHSGQAHYRGCWALDLILGKV